MVKWFKQNSSVRVDYKSDSIIYVWDSVMKKQQRVILGDIISEKEIDQLNKEVPLKAQKYILSKI